jgi:hypothetical protein
MQSTEEKLNGFRVKLPNLHAILRYYHLLIF